MIYLATPSYSGISAETHRSLLRASSQQITHSNLGQSVHTYCFNSLWADCLTRYAALSPEEQDNSYFCMLHSDIDVVEDNWLDWLIDLAEEYNYAILSTVVPLKDDTGLTSTALYEVVSDTIVRRLTLHDCSKLPPVFTNKDVIDLWQLRLSAGFPMYKQHVLLVNTGCMLVRLASWCEQLYFHTRDWLRKEVDDSTGEVTYKAQMISEDWLFSIDASRLGIQAAATTAIELNHVGSKKYSNQGIWGTLQTDDLRG